MDQGKPMKNEDSSWNTKSSHRTSHDPYLYEYVNMRTPKLVALRFTFLK